MIENEKVVFFSHQIPDVSWTKEIGNVERNTTKCIRSNLVDLNVDCQLLILSELDIVSLISLAEVNERFLFLVKNILRRKFEKKLVIFVIPQLNGKIEQYIHEDIDYIKIQHLKVILKLLRHFGHLIQNLKIHYNYLPNNKVSHIYKFVNMYCSETLQQLHMINSYENLFNQLTKPFKKVENLTLRGKFDRLSTCELSFNEVFPAIRTMALDMVNVADMSWIDQKFPHLEHLKMFIWGNNETSECFQESTAKTLIQNNPQIRSLMLRHATPIFLKFISNELPDLRALELHSFNDSNEGNLEIVFDKVTVFKMQHGLQSVPKNVTFHNLEEFQTDGFPKRCSKWFELIEHHKSLKRLNVIQRCLDDEDISKIASQNLTEFSTGFDQNIKDVSILKFIGNSTNLKKIKIIKYFGNDCRKSFETIYEAMQQKFGSDWQIRDSAAETTFERNTYA